MTPEEQAVHICERLGIVSISASTAIAGAIRAAVAEEREACAKEAEQMFEAAADAKDYAEAIRARGKG